MTAVQARPQQQHTEVRFFRLDGRVVALRASAPGQVELRADPDGPPAYLVVHKASRSRLRPDVVRLPVGHSAWGNLRLQACAEGECSIEDVGSDTPAAEVAPARTDRIATARTFLAELRAHLEPVR